MSLTVDDRNVTSEVAQLIEKKLSADTSLGEIRNEAFKSFQRLGLPENKAEEYKDTPITRILQKNFSLHEPPLSSGISVDNLTISSLDANKIVLVNGVFSKKLSVISSPEEEVTILSLKEALAQKNQLALKHVGQYADFKNDALTAWNTAAWNDGVFIHIKNNKIVQKPIVIHHVHDASKDEVHTVTRNLWVSGINSNATIVEKFDSVGTSNHFSNHINEAVIAENAELNFYSIQNDSGNRYQFNLTQFHQANHSRLNTFTFTLSGKLVRNNLQLALDGEGIESHMYGLYLLHKDSLADNHTVVDHRKANSFSNELYKGIMDDNSKGVFNGKIYVRPNAQKTNAFQANRNILLTEKATINTKPQLEIWADDVKCSHGCTTGQLDEEAMFYLQTRGISKESARAMMLYAFAGEILDHVKHAELKHYLDQLISERLHKNF